MRPATYAVLLFLVAAVSGVRGINSTVSKGVGNSSLQTNLSTTVMPITQVSTDLPVNATDTTPGIKKGKCYDFDVFVLNNQLNIPYTVTCCIAVLCGFYLILFGYRFFKCSLFLLGFLHATFVTYVISINHADLPMWGIVAVSAAVGVFCGLLTMFCSYCGLFLAGLGLGFFIGVAIFFVISTFYHVTLVWIPFGVLLGLSLIFSLLTLRWQKGFFIVATSLIGAALITGGVDYFTEEFVLLNYTRQHIMAGDVQVECWVTWIILAIWPVMFILGNVVQFCKTGRSFSHKKRSDSVSLQGEDKAMKRYRSLNMNGDVVAKSYYTKDEDERRPTEV